MLLKVIPILIEHEVKYPLLASEIWQWVTDLKTKFGVKIHLHVPIFIGNHCPKKKKKHFRLSEKYPKFWVSPISKHLRKFGKLKKLDK